MESPVSQTLIDEVLLLPHGKHKAISTHEVLTNMGVEDNDSNRRKFRMAVEYVFMHGSDYELPIATTTGYFLAKTMEEVDICLSRREKTAQAIIDRSKLIREKAQEKFGTRDVHNTL